MGPGFSPWVGKIPWRRERLPAPVFWPGEFHGLCSPWGHKESDMTERLSLHFTSRGCPIDWSEHPRKKAAAIFLGPSPGDQGLQRGLTSSRAAGQQAAPQDSSPSLALGISLETYRLPSHGPPHSLPLPSPHTPAHPFTRSHTLMLTFTLRHPRTPTRACAAAFTLARHSHTHSLAETVMHTHSHTRAHTQCHGPSPAPYLPSAPCWQPGLSLIRP